MENTNFEIKESDQESSIDKANALNRLAHVLSICNIFFLYRTHALVRHSWRRGYPTTITTVKKLRELMLGTHGVNDRSIEFREVLVIRQPSGTFLDVAASSHNFKEFTSGHYVEIPEALRVGPSN